MEPLDRAQHGARRTPHARARARGRRARDRAAARLGRLRRHLAAAARRARARAGGGRSRSTSPASARRRASRQGAILPQLDDFAAALVLEWGAGEPVVVAGNSLGGCGGAAAGRAAPTCRWPASCRWRPPGSRCPAGSTSSSATRSSAAARHPDPGAGRARSARWSAPPTSSSRSPTRRWRSSRWSRRSRRHHGSRANVAALLRVRPPAAARARDRAVRPRRRRVPGAARVGHARPDGPAQRRARGARRAAGDPVELIEGCGHCPQLEATERAARAPAWLPGVIRALDVDAARREPLHDDGRRRSRRPAADARRR